MRSLRFPPTLLPQYLMATSLSRLLEWMGQQDGNLGSKVPFSVNKNQVHNYLGSLNIHKSKGPKEMYPRNLGKQPDTVASMMLEKS